MKAMNDRLHHRAPWAGFTLLEVLVALALLGFILVALAGGVRFGVRAWQAEERRGAGAAELEAVHGLLRRMVATAQPLPLAGLGPPGTTLFFDGRPNEMSFVSDLPDAIGGAGPFGGSKASGGPLRCNHRHSPQIHLKPRSKDLH